MRLFGITGTNGKTTTAWITAAFLDAAYITTVEVFTGKRRFSTGYTTPPLKVLKEIYEEIEEAGKRDCVMEVSSHAIHQNRVGFGDVSVFSGGAFTNISEDHLDYHKTMDEYFRVKLCFAERLGEQGVARGVEIPYVVCVDGEGGERMLAACKAIRGLCVVAASRATTRYDLSGLALVGDYNKSNVAVAAALAEAAGAAPEKIQAMIPILKPRWGRLELVDCASRAKVYVDFAHTPDGLEKVLAAARGFTRGRLWAVFGAGGDRDRAKRPLMGRAVERLADVAVVTSDNPRSENPRTIIDDILAGCAHPECCIVLPDRKEAIHYAVANAEDGDAVLVCGKGHETTQEIAGVKYPFDDRECVAAYGLAGSGAPNGIGR